MKASAALAIAIIALILVIVPFRIIPYGELQTNKLIAQDGIIIEDGSIKIENGSIKIGEGFPWCDIEDERISLHGHRSSIHLSTFDNSVSVHGDDGVVILRINMDSGNPEVVVVKYSPWQKLVISP